MALADFGGANAVTWGFSANPASIYTSMSDAYAVQRGAGAAQRLDPNYIQATALYGLDGSEGLADKQFYETQRQFDASQRNRQQILGLLGLSNLGESGGLLNQPFFQSILGQPIGDVTGDVAGGVAGSGLVSQPGGPDVPASGGDLFSQIVSGRNAERANILGDIANYGDSRRSQINQDYTNLGNTAQARLSARGLDASNLATATATGVEKGRQQALGNLEDQLLSQRINARQGLDEGIFGAAENQLGRNLQERGQTYSFLSGLLGPALGAIKVV